MILEDKALSEMERLSWSSIQAGIKRLRQAGVWPRPPAARRLHLGDDLGYDDVQEIPEVANLVQYLASDEAIKAIYFRNAADPELYVLYHCWVRLLLSVLGETAGMSPTKRVFRKWFARFVKEVYSDTAVWRIADTVTGLTIRGGELRFDQTTALTPIPGYALPSIAGRHWDSLQGSSFFHSWHPGGLDKATIISTVRVRKHDYSCSGLPYPHLTQELGRSHAALAAVRLVKSGVPRLHCHAKFQLSRFPLSGPLLYCNHEGLGTGYEQETVIERNDFRDIRRLWRQPMVSEYWRYPLGLRNPTRMDVALGRFFRTYGQENWLDDMVDLSIALESLFNPTDSQELSHRIALRAAWLLGWESVGSSPGSPSAELYRRIRTMYDVRSGRVHGDIPDEKAVRKWVKTIAGVEIGGAGGHGPLDPSLSAKAVESGRDIVRKAIRACARLQGRDPNKGPHWPLPDNFDEMLVSPIQRRKWQRAAGVTRY